MGIGAKRPAGVKTRDAILQTALGLFLRQGYHATGIRQIALGSEISIAAVYNHFSSKEEIFQALLAEHNLYQRIAEALGRAKGDSLEELLENAFGEIMASLRGRGDFLLLVFIDVLEFRASHAALLVRESMPAILGFIQRLFQLGRERGELREVSPVLVARAFLGMVFSSFVLEDVLKVLPVRLRVPNWERGMVDILLHGVVAHGGEGKADDRR